MKCPTTISCRYLKTVLLTILFLLLLPLLIILIIAPILLWRLFVQSVSKIFCKNYGKLLYSSSNVFATDSPAMFTTQCLGAIYSSLYLDGHIDIVDLRLRYLKIVHQKKTGSSTELRSPEFQQTIGSLMGFYFWKNDPNFNIQNHVRMYEGPRKIEMNWQTDMPIVYDFLTNKPFDVGQSPWEVWVLHTTTTRTEQALTDGENQLKTIIIIRCHHALCDGLSMVKAFVDEEIVKKTLAELERPKDTKIGGSHNKFRLFFQNFALIFKMTFDFIQTGFHYYEDDHEWNLPKMELTGVLNTIKMPSIPLNFVKDLRKMYGVNFNTIMQAACAGGIRNFMIEQGNIKIPQNFSCFVPLPWKNHPWKLRNHATGVLVALPIGMEDPLERVEFLERNFNRLRQSTIPITTYVLTRVWGWFPIQAHKWLAFAKAPTCLLSNIPGPSQKMFECDRPVLEIQVGAGNMRHMGVCIHCVSYDGQLSISVAVDRAIIPSQKVLDRLGQKVVDELYVLKGLQIV